MKIVVGLGNPGKKYEYTRHNIGWLILDSYLNKDLWTLNKKFKALIYKNNNFIFVKPMTFMNNSGEAVQKILNYYKLLPKTLGLISKKNIDLNDNLIVIHDDLDLNFNDYKIATNSGSAGHRGVQSIIDHLKTKQFTRLRLGIKNSFLRNPIPPDKFVLQNFNPEEKEKLPELFKTIYKIIIK